MCRFHHKNIKFPQPTLHSSKSQVTGINIHIRKPILDLTQHKQNDIPVGATTISHHKFRTTNYTTISFTTGLQKQLSHQTKTHKFSLCNKIHIIYLTKRLQNIKIIINSHCHLKKYTSHKMEKNYPKSNSLKDCITFQKYNSFNSMKNIITSHRLN